MAVKEVPIWEKTTLTIEEAAEYSNYWTESIIRIAQNTSLSVCVVCRKQETCEATRI